MIIDLDDFDKRCEEIRAENNKLLDMFEAHLKEQGLAQSTIDKHLGNMDFYLNYFLLYYEALTMEDGLDKVSHFLGNWFLRKAMWASQATIKSNISSMKKFYAYMVDLGKIPAGDYKKFLRTIKEVKDDWLENCRAMEEKEARCRRKSEEIWNRIDDDTDDTEGDLE